MPKTNNPTSSSVSTVKRFALLALILAALTTQAFASRKERLIDSWKPTHYNVSLTLNERLNEITSARAEITIVSLRNKLSVIDLDFGGLAVDSVTVNHRAASYQRAGELLNVRLPAMARRGTNLIVIVSYHGKPKDGLIMTADKAGKPSVVGDNWPNRVHHWIPTLDHPSAKATVTFSITAPAGSAVVANGGLSRVVQTSNTVRTWTFTQGVPIPPYCMVIAVGDFALVEPAGRQVTRLSYYVPQPDRAYAMQGFAAANPSLKFFTETIAPYPYEKLAMIVGATRFGGMENSSAIVFPSTLFDSKFGQPISSVFNVRDSLVEVIAHEIAHQWFGDSVTEATWSDLWLSEGFAQYFAGLFVERHEGQAAFQKYMTRQAQEYFNFEKGTRRPIHDTETEDLFKLLNANNYQKGAWVLHMLRSELGDEKFFSALRQYYEAHRNATATTEDLRTSLEKASGRDLKPFFASWIYGAGHPRYELSWKWRDKTRKVRLTVRQLQTEPAFPNTLPIEILTTSGKRRIVLKPTRKETIEEVGLDEPPLGMNLDPENTVLKEVTKTQ